MNASAAATTNETEVWSGTPSQWRHLGLYTLCTLIVLALLIASIMLRTHVSPWIPLALIVIPVFIAGKRYVQTLCDHITLTDQRLILRRGVFNRVTDYVELYRVKDSHFTQPFVERLLGLGTIQLRTTQDSEPLVVLSGMRGPEALWNQLRGLVEARRIARGVRELDVNSEVSG
ncbi:MAG: PH domain-containing protein [Proteobacteria bacterium]|nr:PH domain-containing protein [Pseudomonadota bacterium]